MCNKYFKKSVVEDAVRNDFRFDIFCFMFFFSNLYTLRSKCDKLDYLSSDLLHHHYEVQTFRLLKEILLQYNKGIRYHFYSPFI